MPVDMFVLNATSSVNGSYWLRI